MTAFKKMLRDNGLSICLLTLFSVCLLGQILSGWHVSNHEHHSHGEAAQTLAVYLSDGHFLEAVFENWESEFLQMALYVLLTVYLVQRGSAESKKPEGGEEIDDDPLKHQRARNAPWPVKKGGWILSIYNYSLSLVLGLFFLLSFILHAIFGLKNYNEELLAHHEPLINLRQYLGSSQFWFESFQNWQSEFLSIAEVVILSIYLRQIGSPESKPVHFPHNHTGKD